MGRVWQGKVKGSDDAGVGVGGDGILDTVVGDVLVMGTERQVIYAVLQQDLHLPILFFVVPSQHLQILGQMHHLTPQFLILSPQQHVLLHRSLQLTLQLPHLHQELLVNHWLVDVDGVFHGDLDWHLYPPLDLDRRLLDVEGLVNVHRLFHNRGDRHLYCLYHLLLNFLNYFHWHFLLHFDILGDFHHLLNDALGTGHESGNFHCHFDWLFDNHFLDDFFGNSGLEPSDLLLPLFKKFPEKIQVDFQPILLSLELVDGPFVLGTHFGAIPEVIKFKVEPNTFLFGFFELLLQLLDLLEQFFETVFVLVVLLDLNLDLFVACALPASEVHALHIDFLFPWRNADWHPRLYLLPRALPPRSTLGVQVDLRGLGGFELLFWFEDCLLFDDDGLLQ